jgi:hypothetical protein
MATLVGAVKTASSLSASTIAITAWSNTAGNPIIVTVRWEDATTTSAITDTAGNTYTGLTLVSHASLGLHTRIFYCLAPTANASNVVTMTLGATRGYLSMTVSEWSGALSYQTEGSASATDSSLTCSNMTAVGAGLSVASAASYNAQPAWAPSTGYTKVDVTLSASVYHALLYKVVASAGTEAPGFTSGGSDLAIAGAVFNDEVTVIDTPLLSQLLHYEAHL